LTYSDAELIMTFTILQSLVGFCVQYRSTAHCKTLSQRIIQYIYYNTYIHPRIVIQTHNPHV